MDVHGNLSESIDSMLQLVMIWMQLGEGDRFQVLSK